MIRTTLVACTVAFLAAGCADPKAANNANFQKAVVGGQCSLAFEGGHHVHLPGAIKAFIGA